MTAAGADPGVGDEQEIAALAAWIDHGNAGAQARTVSGQELLAGSEFQVAAASEDGGVLTIWGQGAYGRFAGHDERPCGRRRRRQRDAGSGLCNRAMDGVALSHSSGWGSYSQPMTTGGEVTSSLTGAYPYVGLEVVPERLSLWVAGGYGLGGLRLTPAGGAALETGIGLLAGAAGVRGTVVAAAATGGFSLGVNADGLLLRATSDAAPGLAATTADVVRLRLGLEGAYEVTFGDGARLTPSVEVERAGATTERRRRASEWT